MYGESNIILDVLTKMTKIEIAKNFSNGYFEKTYPHISEDAEWDVVEENKFVGKKAIIEQCEQVTQYFKSVKTKFETFNIITEGNKVVISGTAEFIRDKQQVSFVYACDIYEFNKNDHLEKITSYCIKQNDKI